MFVNAAVLPREPDIFRVVVFNATFDNISAILVLLVEETGENYRSAASHRQTLPPNVVSNTPHPERDSTHNVNGYMH